MPSGLTVWCGGFAAPPLAREAGIAVDDQGAVLTDGALRSLSHPAVLAVGDAGHAPAPDGERYSMSCQFAFPSAAHAADALVADVLIGFDGAVGDRPLDLGFTARCVSLGRRHAVLQPTTATDVARGRAVTGRAAVLAKRFQVRGIVAAIGLERRLPGAIRWPHAERRRRGRPVGRRIGAVTRTEEFTALRPLLFAIAYRILGSVSEAEDAVQETWLRYESSATEPASVKSFLSAVVTRLSIDVLRSARVRRESYVGPWFPEPLLTDPYEDPERSAELADSVSMAALLLLERLSPLERAVFVLREVFGFDFPEIASAVGRSEAACRQLAVRARRHMEEGRPRFAADRREREELAARFFDAFARRRPRRAPGAARRRRPGGHRRRRQGPGARPAGGRVRERRPAGRRVRRPDARGRRHGAADDQRPARRDPAGPGRQDRRHHRRSTSSTGGSRRSAR